MQPIVWEEAEPLYRRALSIDEASYGPSHPKVAIRLNNLALLLRATNRLEEAEPLYRRGLIILLKFRHSTGHEHPNFQDGLRNYVIALQNLGFAEEEIQQRLEQLVHE